tara:strand:+ start:170 stop:523 length:354 start_codon:yes stop_codon:yes gene_type:complete
MSIAPMLFYRGYANPDKFEPLSFGWGDEDVDEDDMYAIATGDEEYLAAHCTLKQPKSKKKKKKPKPKTNQSLIQDCIDILIALGEKKSIARATVNKYFANNPKTKTVDEFIKGVFQK